CPMSRSSVIFRSWPSVATTAATEVYRCPKVSTHPTPRSSPSCRTRITARSLPPPAPRCNGKLPLSLFQTSRPMTAKYLGCLLAIGLACCNQPQTTTTPQTPIPYGDNAAAGHYLDTRGFKMYYETYGEG